MRIIFRLTVNKCITKFGFNPVIEMMELLIEKDDIE
jgi:hypothetical protein